MLMAIRSVAAYLHPQWPGQNVVVIMDAEGGCHLRWCLSHCFVCWWHVVQLSKYPPGPIFIHHNLGSNPLSLRIRVFGPYFLPASIVNGFSINMF